ncbi:ExbD/TolR family protein [Oceanidesulfovibrio marinus]|uniref:ExbD/TolR family protein n=1 Tax=Oceanidesulfovibrio marinus TaxID=370038 RepID=A0A6P1ZD73_9BACT|nr:ExbD/TolR family protein [Oceanidesulfovibrio marinus]QJT10958.1 ExbD/TolR family protein [Oceanidesulfovibrio marinus]TVM31425.1 protein TolR [Oceanidesulfovibrio marinus]
MSRRKQRKLASEINVTPFVDVMLVLLIIFMVTAPMMTEGLEVELPQTKTVETLPAGQDQIVVGVKGEGAVYVNEHAVPLAALARHLGMTAGNSHTVLLQADRSVPYGRIVDVMGRIREAGVQHLGIVARRSGRDE